MKKGLMFIVLALLMFRYAAAIETEEGCFLLLKSEVSQRLNADFPLSFSEFRALPLQEIDASSSQGGYSFSIYSYGASTKYPLSMTKNETDTYMESNIVFFYTPEKRLAECDFFLFNVNADNADAANFTKPVSFLHASFNSSYEDKGFFGMLQSYRIDDVSGDNAMNRTSINLVPVENRDALAEAESAGGMQPPADAASSEAYQDNARQSAWLQWMLLTCSVAFAAVLGIVFFRAKRISYRKIIASIEKDIEQKNPAKASREYNRLVKIYRRIDNRNPRKKEVYDEIVRMSEKLKAAFKSS